MTYSSHFPTLKTPQSSPIPGSSQVQNSAGGYAFPVDDWTRLDRFLILGNEGGSYYASEAKMTVENAQAVMRCLKADGARLVERVRAISLSGRAPKNKPALFVLGLALSHGDPATKAAAYKAIPDVARYSTDLFGLVAEVQQHRGWGRGLRRAVANWYNGKSGRDLAYQIIKYQNRDGWTHTDLLRLSHPKPFDAAHEAIYHYIAKGWEGTGDEPHPDPALVQIWAFEKAKQAKNAAEIIRLITDYRLPRECVPTQFLTDPKVWEALLVDMPITAMLRNLATMTRVGLIAPMAAANKVVADRLTNEDILKRGRVHPLSILVAMNTYAGGRGIRGDNSWTPVGQVIDALDEAFYKSFGFVQSTGKRWLLALDVSRSMTWGTIAGMTGVTPRTGSAAMAMLTARTEAQHHIMGFSHTLTPIAITPRQRFMGFSHTLTPIAITPRQRLDDVVKVIEGIPMGETDCSLPMVYALQNRIPVDVFAVYTDSETWAGKIHPVQALREYRNRMGIPAKLIVVGMESNGFSIADPDDAGMMDVIGFDTAAPGIMADFAIS
jgi:60 kDa SS-A/Ro ribonucleoprotein